MAKIERTYNIPLRKDFLKAPPYKRAKRAVTAVRDFLTRHMKSEQILIGPYLNESIWERGIKNPPHHIEVKVVKNDEGVVRAELVGAPEDFFAEKKEKEDKKSKKKEDAAAAEEKKEEKKSHVPKNPEMDNKKAKQYDRKDVADMKDAVKHAHADHKTVDK